MAMLPPVYQWIKAWPAATAILGANPKVYRHGLAPANTVAPYVTWMVIGAEPSTNLTSLPFSDRIVFEVDCYHTADGGIESLAQAVRDAIEPYAVLTAIPIDQKETDTALFRIALQFDHFMQRTPA